MKKILLSLILICAFVIVKAQVVCGSGNIFHWTGAGDPGDQGPSPAPIVINGTSADWEQYITGPFNYSVLPAGGFEPNPYVAAIAQANVQVDGLRNATGSDYDRDVPGQDHRDLRYFAFTYDQKNVYFIFRRPKNNTAQVSLYYFIDIDLDGYMRTGEPVIHVTFNNSGSSIEMGYYEAVNSNGTAPGSYDAVKGNLMSTPTGVTRAKNPPNTSEWSPGSADGWNMPGNFISFGNGVTLPALAPGEVFDSRTLIDTYTGGVQESGYGVEFAVPWQYFRMYNAQGANGTPLTYQSLFSWHVSLVSGASGISGAEDNAGGCCSGVAVSGAPVINRSATWAKTSSNPYDYRLSITYTNQRNYPTIVSTYNIVVVDPKDANGQPIPENVIKNWTFIGYKDADCSYGNESTADSAHFVYSLTSGTTYTFQAYSPLKPRVTAPGTIGSTACYYINVNAFGWPPLASATIQWNFSTEFDISSNNCNNVTGGGSAGSLDVLPVKFLSFNAVRSGSNVNLTWQTATEEGNAGFEVQKFMGSGDWQTITFVPTQAVNGYSNTTLNYVLTDINTSRGVTQYRLKQIDKNNKSAYSVIRSVRGEGQKGKTIVYPNPSSDGKVNIIFEDVKGIRDVSVTDMSGRMIKQMKAVTNNNIQIDNLNAGMYTVRVLNVETGEQVVEKFVVNKR